MERRKQYKTNTKKKKLVVRTPVTVQLCSVSNIYLQDLFHFNNPPDDFIVPGFVSLVVILAQPVSGGAAGLLQDAAGLSPAVVVGVSVISGTKCGVLDSVEVSIVLHPAKCKF